MDKNIKLSINNKEIDLDDLFKEIFGVKINKEDSSTEENKFLERRNLRPRQFLGSRAGPRNFDPWQLRQKLNINPTRQITVRKIFCKDIPAREIILEMNQRIKTLEDLVLNKKNNTSKTLSKPKEKPKKPKITKKVSNVKKEKKDTGKKVGDKKQK